MNSTYQVSRIKLKIEVFPYLDSPDDSASLEYDTGGESSDKSLVVRGPLDRDRLGLFCDAVSFIDFKMNSIPSKS